MTENIKELIIKNKPNISKSSITTYLSILKNLYINVFKDDKFDLDKFDNADKILSSLKDLEPNKRKTILAALVVITDNKKYRDQMMKDIEEYKSNESKQIKSEKQTDSWVDTSEIDDIYEAMTKNVSILYKKKDLSMTDFQEIQNYIILCVLSGKFIPPRRSKDFVDFKIKNIDKEKDNFLDKNKMYFNSYKTSSTYGQQVVDIPIQLKNILNKWIKINPTEYLLFDSNMNKLSSVKLNQRLNKLFNKKCSVNQLRHTYLTNKFSHTIKEKEEIKDTMQDMGSSSNMLQTYVKK